MGQGQVEVIDSDMSSQIKIDLRHWFHFKLRLRTKEQFLQKIHKKYHNY